MSTLRNTRTQTVLIYNSDTRSIVNTNLIEATDVAIGLPFSGDDVNLARGYKFTTFQSTGSYMLSHSAISRLSGPSTTTARGCVAEGWG